MGRAPVRERLAGLFRVGLACFRGDVFAEGNPRLVAHGIVGSGLNRPVAEGLFFAQGRVPSALGWRNFFWSAHGAL